MWTKKTQNLVKSMMVLCIITKSSDNFVTEWFCINTVLFQFVLDYKN